MVFRRWEMIDELRLQHALENADLQRRARIHGSNLWLYFRPPDGLEHKFEEDDEIVALKSLIMNITFATPQTLEQPTSKHFRGEHIIFDSPFTTKEYSNAEDDEIAYT